MKSIFICCEAAVFTACAPKQAEQTEQTIDSVATEVKDTTVATAPCRYCCC